VSEFSVDPSKAQFVLPKGEYNVVVVKAERKAPKQGEHDYIEVQMAITEGEFENKIAIDRLSLAPKAAFRLAQFVRACGLAKREDKGEMSFDTDALVGQQLTMKGDVEEGKGAFGDTFRPNRYSMHPGVAKSLEESASKPKADPVVTKEEKKPEAKKPSGKPITI
jgi:hypothetical protein